MKCVRFLVEPGEPKILKLSKDLFIVYSGCPFKGRRGCEGECHDCMQGDLWPACEVQLEFVGEVWWEFFVLSAGGQVIEKWREIMRLRSTSGTQIQGPVALINTCELPP